MCQSRKHTLLRHIVRNPRTHEHIQYMIMFTCRTLFIRVHYVNADVLRYVGTALPWARCCPSPLLQSGEMVRLRRQLQVRHLRMLMVMCIREPKLNSRL